MSTQTHVWLLTGPPGIGKSTVVTRVVYLLRMKGHGIGGCVTKEKREGRQRVGFTINDIMSGREAELASDSTSLGPRVGRYRVNIAGLRDVGAKSLEEAGARADVIVIDEVGPMELTSAEFRKAAEGCLLSRKPMLAVIHEQMKDPLLEKFRDAEGATLTEVTLHNRDGLPQKIAGELDALLAANASAP